MLFPPPTPNSQFHALFSSSFKKKKQREGGKEIHTSLYKKTKMENKIGGKKSKGYAQTKKCETKVYGNTTEW